MVAKDSNKVLDAYLVIDKCDMDLKKLLRSNKFLDEIQVKSILYDILCGLNYLHKAQICHRDLKPENILVNDDCTIQICDYGLSRSLKGVDEEIEIEDEMEEMKAASKSPSNDGQEEQKAMYTKDNRPCLNLKAKAEPLDSNSITD